MAEGWVHEIKWDGYRAQAHIAAGQATVYSRSGLDWTREFRSVSEAVAQIRVKSAIIDGEAVVIGKGGKLSSSGAAVPIPCSRATKRRPECIRPALHGALAEARQT